ncbi:hypothetical protein [Asaia sp. As-1742]|uniref:hypothetical protein n=1 Tax=Asaia sp. As-1742 TaxID=2608325 RepID=UPI0014222823|nr:hypothetical protein [Asaia sp. As-1742]NIE81584.1 hypothetical protein [Asaia sp. As-1742]
MPTARLALLTGLPSLLALFATSEVSRAVEPYPQAERIWRETLARSRLSVFVSDGQDRTAATCMLVTAPNPVRGGQLRNFVENVVTHADPMSFDDRALAALPMPSDQIANANPRVLRATERKLCSTSSKTT